MPFLTLLHSPRPRTTTASALLSASERLLGAPLNIRLRAWDGSEAGPDGSPGTIVFTSSDALRHIFWSPNELGLVRAFVAGDIDIEGNIVSVLDQPDVIARFGHHQLAAIRPAAVLRTLGTLVSHGGLGRPLPAPSTETPPEPGFLHRHGVARRHSKERDAQAISHHYDVGNDFYRLLLGPTMVYSCGYWQDGPDGDLESAQIDKLELICRKLDLRPGMRLLDVGCGWGSLAIHAARRHGVTVVGVTLSHEQRDLALERVAAAGLSDQVEIRFQDYRDVTDGPFDAIASVGMSEHVGHDELAGYADHLATLLRPRGRLLNHAIAAVRPVQPRKKNAPSFIERYIFPDGEILPLSDTLTAMESAALEVRDTEALREHYGLTLRAWTANLQANWDAAVEIAGIERARTWLLYLATCALAFERGRVTIHQVLAVKQDRIGASGMGWNRRSWTDDGDRSA